MISSLEDEIACKEKLLLNFELGNISEEDFLEKKISPFMELRAGVDIAIEGASGFYGNFSFGCRLKRFSLSAGVESMKGQDYDFPYYYVGRRERVYYGNFDESAEPYGYRAFNFVTRFSFEF